MTDVAVNLELKVETTEPLLQTISVETETTVDQQMIELHEQTIRTLKNLILLALQVKKRVLVIKKALVRNLLKVT